MPVGELPRAMTRSARLPGSGVPISWAGPSSSAASDVPARIAPIGVIPDSTRYAGSRRFVPCAAMPQSVPMATRTPRSMACGMCRRATVSQCFFFAYAQLVAFSGSGVGVRRGRRRHEERAAAPPSPSPENSPRPYRPSISAR